jgi:hypothetical protein
LFLLKEAKIPTAGEVKATANAITINNCFSDNARVCLDSTSDCDILALEIDIVVALASVCGVGDDNCVAVDSGLNIIKIGGAIVINSYCSCRTRNS